MKKILTILLLVSFSFTFTNCDSYLDVNNNEDAPDYISEELYLSGIIAAMGNLSYDIRATAPLSQTFGTTSYTTFATHYYSQGSDAAGETWRIAYWLHGMNMENMINQSLEHESYTLAGIGYAIKAFTWDILTKLHGELPLKEAFVPGLLSHQYDYQPEVYTQIREWAKTAIEYLEMEDHTSYGNRLKEADLIYGGDKAKWIKFAHSVIVRNLSSLTNKNNFTSEYAQELLNHAALAMQNTSDDATFAMPGGGSDAQFSSYNNNWGPYLGTGSDYYFASDFAIQVMTGTMPVYDETTGDKIKADPDPETGEVSKIYPFKLADRQYVSDTSKAAGHFDPRITAKVGTTSANDYRNMDNPDSIKTWIYYGGGFTSWYGPIGQAANLWGSRAGYTSTSSIDGTGRWLYRNDAPVILMTSAEMQFCVAEAQWKLGNKQEALAAMQKGVALDVEFTGKYLYPGKPKVTGQDEDGNNIYALYGELPGGDVVTTKAYNQLANEYIAGPYVNGLSVEDLTLSHIMLQKFVAMMPWGCNETWVDMRKYHYDIKYTGEYPSMNNGWTQTTIDQKWDTDETKVYKGLYLAPAQVENRRGTYNVDNEGSPCYRIRPRYNSEYMWNKESLSLLKPISGMAKNYHCSIPWFAYPGDYPTSL